MKNRKSVYDKGYHVMEVPSDYGIMIKLNHTKKINGDGVGSSSRSVSSTTTGTHNVTIDFVSDAHYPSIHPNCYAPASLHNLTILKGGGSGTAVFGGEFFDIGVVMKHGNSKDTGEVLSLATIQNELARRGAGEEDAAAAIVCLDDCSDDNDNNDNLHHVHSSTTTTTMTTQDAAIFLSHRIPEFLFVYISPCHVRNRGLELWRNLQHRVRRMIELKRLTTNSTSTATTRTTSDNTTNSSSPNSSYKNNNNINENEAEDYQIFASSSPTSSPAIKKQRENSTSSSISRSYSFHSSSSASSILNNFPSRENSNERSLMDDYDAVTLLNEPGPKISTKKNDEDDCPLQKRRHEDLKSVLSNLFLNEMEQPNPKICRGLAVGKSTEPGQWQFVVSEHHVLINGPDFQIESKEQTTTSFENPNASYNENLIDDEAETLTKQIVVGEGANIICPLLATVMGDCQTHHHWKFTLGQKKIGGYDYENAANVLTNGQLNVGGSLLQTLKDEFTLVMKALQRLTFVNEKTYNLSLLHEQLQRVMDKVGSSSTSSYKESQIFDVKKLVPKSLDLYVAGAIHKNYDPIHGRLHNLRVLGDAFRRFHTYRTTTAPPQQNFPACSKNGTDTTITNKSSIKTSDDKTATAAANDRPHSPQTFHLEESELLPSWFLGKVLERGVNLSDVYVKAPASQSALDIFDQPQRWIELLQMALSFSNNNKNSGGENHNVPVSSSISNNIKSNGTTSPSSSSSLSSSPCSEYIWTSGLTDAGLHNCFLSQDRGLQLFDLGEPTLMSLPAFLTKFLMSFFHAFGMEDENDCNDTTSSSSTTPGCAADSRWVKRFDVIERNDYESECGNNCTIPSPSQPSSERRRLLLDPKQSTKDMIPYIYDVFLDTCDHFVKHVFDDEPKIKPLLIRYVVLQLLSDASFCLGRWQKKGGGCQVRGERTGLEKWLWRALWDLYIASHVTNKLLPDI